MDPLEDETEVALEGGGEGCGRAEIGLRGALRAAEGEHGDGFARLGVLTPIRFRYVVTLSIVASIA